MRTAHILIKTARWYPYGVVYMLYSIFKMKCHKTCAELFKTTFQERIQPNIYFNLMTFTYDSYSVITSSFFYSNASILPALWHRGPANKMALLDESSRSRWKNANIFTMSSLINWAIQGSHRWYANSSGKPYSYT